VELSIFKEITLKPTKMAKPQKCISVQEAKALYSNWISTRGASLASVLGSQDTSDVFFTVEELEEYLAYVKSESAKQNIAKPGIRIYFGAYDNKTSNKATVFLAPTDGNLTGSSNNYNIEPFNFGNGGWPPNIY
jgi:hypothetical protein